jgi:hypothetical protein
MARFLRRLTWVCWDCSRSGLLVTKIWSNTPKNGKMATLLSFTKSYYEHPLRKSSTDEANKPTTARRK